MHPFAAEGMRCGGWWINRGNTEYYVSHTKASYSDAVSQCESIGKLVEEI